MPLSSKSLAIVYHSPYGHTAKVASFIAQGAEQAGIHVHCMNIEHVDWDILDQADAIVFGCPTYMGSLTAALKLFMEQSSKRWLARTWQGKIAAGFTNGGGLSGDKVAVLPQIYLFAMAYGMLWTDLSRMANGRRAQGLNRKRSGEGRVGERSRSRWWPEH